jgi:two-component system heavy metal sensor histidine kinase CusS
VKPRSLSARLIVWYVLSSFALVAAASGTLYAVLASELGREDVRLAHDELDSIRLILKATDWPRVTEVPVIGREGIDRELYVRLVAPDGRVMLQTAGMDRITGPAPKLDESRLAASGIGSRRRESDGDTYQLLTAPVAVGRRQGFIEIAMNHGDEDDLLALYRMRLLTVLAISLAITGALGYWLARSSMRPIERIGRVAERIGSSTLHERIATEGLPEELRQVASTFNTMLDRIEESFARVGQFSDDVAHELRTPVNNLRGQIEVALARARSPGDYEQMLGSCLEECDRISRIISSLLFLARVGGSNALALMETPVSAEIEAVRDFYEASANEAGIAIETDAPPILRWRLDRTLFQQALGNLVSNAIAHARSATIVRITAAADGAALRITVSDDGDGIANGDQHRLFDRFFRVDRARAGADHAGLGLSMVKAIVERHGGSVTIESKPGNGLAITMAFPRQDDDSVI